MCRLIFFKRQQMQRVLLLKAWNVLFIVKIINYWNIFFHPMEKMCNFKLSASLQCLQIIMRIVAFQIFAILCRSANVCAGQQTVAPLGKLLILISSENVCTTRNHDLWLFQSKSPKFTQFAVISKPISGVILTLHRNENYWMLVCTGGNNESC